MDLDATPYRAFVTVAEERSFTRAAMRMNVSQPALSAQIKELERRLGFPLFARTSRSVELTLEGRLFLGNARRVVIETRWLNNVAREIRENQLRVGASHYTSLIAERQRLIDHFIVSQPTINLRLIDQVNEKQYADLTREQIDLAIVLEPSEATACGTGALNDADWPRDLQRLTLGERPMRLLVPIEHPWARQEAVCRSDLEGQAVAVINRSHGAALTVTVARNLGEAGARLIRPPEGHALAVEHYAKITRVPAISLGWFERATGTTSNDMVPRPFVDLDMRSSLTLLRSSNQQRPASEIMWAMAKMMIQSFRQS